MIVNLPFFKIPESPIQSDISSDLALLVLSVTRTPEEDDLLSKILSATGLSSEAIKIVDPDEHIRLSAFSHEIRPPYILLFGRDGDSIGLQARLRKYRPVTILGTTILRVDTLADIMRTKQLKAHLWQYLKAWFHD